MRGLSTSPPLSASVIALGPQRPGMGQTGLPTLPPALPGDIRGAKITLGWPSGQSCSANANVLPISKGIHWGGIGLVNNLRESDSGIMGQTGQSVMCDTASLVRQPKGLRHDEWSELPLISRNIEVVASGHHCNGECLPRTTPARGEGATTTEATTPTGPSRVPCLCATVVSQMPRFHPSTAVLSPAQCVSVHPPRRLYCVRGNPLAVGARC